MLSSSVAGKWMPRDEKQHFSSGARWYEIEAKIFYHMAGRMVGFAVRSGIVNTRRLSSQWRTCGRGHSTARARRWTTHTPPEVRKSHAPVGAAALSAK